MNWSNVLYLVALAISVISLLYNVIKKRKNAKNSGKDDSGGFWSEIFQKLPDYIISAENFYNQIVGKVSGVKTGAQKLAQVLDKIKIDCLTAGVAYDEEKATEMVESLVDLTNKVNTNK